MGLKFKYRRTRCTGSYRDKPLLEVRWTTEEGAYSLDDLIAGDLGVKLPELESSARARILPEGECGDVPARPDAGNGNGTVVFAGPAPENALAIRRTAIRVRRMEEDPPLELGTGLLNKIV